MTSGQANDPFSPEVAPLLSVGSVVGGTTGPSTTWLSAITKMQRAVIVARGKQEDRFRLNVVFHVPGEILDPGFLGVRTGHYSRKHAPLIVQVAVLLEKPDDIDAFVRTAMEDAIDAAEPLAQRRARVSDLQLQRDILAAADELIGQGIV